MCWGPWTFSSSTIACASCRCDCGIRNRIPRMRAPERVVWQDTIVVALATAIMAFICVELDVSEALRRWTAPWERFQLDELPAVLLVLAVGLAWLAVRRYGEAGRELRRREVAE